MGAVWPRSPDPPCSGRGAPVTACPRAYRTSRTVVPGAGASAVNVGVGGQYRQLPQTSACQPPDDPGSAPPNVPMDRTLLDRQSMSVRPPDPLLSGSGSHTVSAVLPT